MREVKLIASENEIPKDYHYDTENSWVYEYRNPYTGNVIQVAKEPPLYVKTALIVEELEKIREEMIEKCKDYRWDNDDVVSDSLIRIVDNHIAELKGE